MYIIYIYMYVYSWHNQIPANVSPYKRVHPQFGGNHLKEMSSLWTTVPRAVSQRKKEINRDQLYNWYEFIDGYIVYRPRYAIPGIHIQEKKEFGWLLRSSEASRRAPHSDPNESKWSKYTNDSTWMFTIHWCQKCPVQNLQKTSLASWRSSSPWFTASHFEHPKESKRGPPPTCSRHALALRLHMRRPPGCSWWRLVEDVPLGWCWTAARHTAIGQPFPWWGLSDPAKSCMWSGRNMRGSINGVTSYPKNQGL